MRKNITYDKHATAPSSPRLPNALGTLDPARLLTFGASSIADLVSWSRSVPLFSDLLNVRVRLHLCLSGLLHSLPEQISQFQPLAVDRDNGEEERLQHPPVDEDQD
jgi:hypothetical protein